MSARKLSRLAGLVFVLATLVGGIGLVHHVAKHEAGGQTAVSAFMKVTLEVIWS